MPNHYAGDLLRTMPISGLSRVRTALLERTTAQSLAPRTIQVTRQLSGHSPLRDLPSPSHREVEKLTAPLCLAAYRDLGGFHQKKTQQSVALLADVSQSAPIAAGL